MFIGEEIPMLGDWFILHFTENRGMAFGMEFGGDGGKLFLSIFRLLAVAGLSVGLWKLIKRNAHKGLIISLSLIIAGALGNILDSAFYGLLFGDSHYQVAQFLPEGGGYAPFLFGNVVDMLYFPVINGTFPDWFPFWGGEDFQFFRPVFNISDAAISIGVFIIIIRQKKYFGKSKKTVEAAPEDDDASEAAVEAPVSEASTQTPDAVTDTSTEQPAPPAETSTDTTETTTAPDQSKND